MIDPAVRDDFLNLDHKVFFNNAAFAPLLKPVKAAIDNYLLEVAGLQDGFKSAVVKLAQLRQNCAALIGAQPEEIGYTTNTSTGMNLAVTGLEWNEGDEVIIADNEFPAVIYPFRSLTRQGVKLNLVPTPDGNFSLAEVEKFVTDRTRLLAVSFVQFFNGHRNQIKKIGEFCKERGIFYVVDGIQGIGHCPIDVHDCHIDLLGCGGPKWLLGLPGSGFFFVNRSAKEHLQEQSTGWMGIDWGADFSDLHGFDRAPYPDERRHDLGTYPFIQLWTLEAATGYLKNLEIENICKYNQSLLNPLLDYVENSSYYTLRSSREPQHRSSFISIGSPAGFELQQHLVGEDFMLVFREGGLRVAVNFYNTAEEIERLIVALDRFAASH